MRTHWLEQRPYWTGKHPACGVSRDRPASEDPGDVTCLTCQKRIEADMRSTDDVAEEQDEPHEMWVCETHRHQGNHASCCFDTAKKMGDVYAAAGGEWRPSVNTCRMVRRLLVDPGDNT